MARLSRLFKSTSIYGRSCCDSCPSACLKLLLVILRSFPACILMSVEPEAMADVVRWCQEKRLDLGEEPRPWALFYFFGRMDCLFCWPRRRCFLLSFARNPLVAVDVNKRWSDCKGAVSLGKIWLCRGTRSSASHTSEARATQVLSSKGPAATGPFLRQRGFEYQHGVRSHGALLRDERTYDGAFCNHHLCGPLIICVDCHCLR